MGDIVQIWPADDETDRHRATDYFVEVPSGTVACRIRRASTSYRDLTLRHSVPSGAPTETDKVEAGCVRWYLYAWADRGKFLDWIFVDLAIVREAGLIRDAILGNQRQYNDDGTSFLWITFGALLGAGAIVRSFGDVGRRAS